MRFICLITHSPRTRQIDFLRTTRTLLPHPTLAHSPLTARTYSPLTTHGTHPLTAPDTAPLLAHDAAPVAAHDPNPRAAHHANSFAAHDANLPTAHEAAPFPADDVDDVVRTLHSTNMLVHTCAFTRLPVPSVRLSCSKTRHKDLKVNAESLNTSAWPDRYIEVPGGSNNCANVDLIVDVAERAGVHAVWAGWGHASENPRLSESLAASKNKIVFIGPPRSAMRSLGDI
ncbi:hypothetical protein PLICRDRAFT_181000 [Plicaturopsis crispa FD-325 SS-3]|uniref:Biotin carboxylation domain-containing protein n=1 Tax=Plicaturopsis crispa FD-325 SS-3 TaxID=944288 RepID=A0A0C9SJY9_PLICR|nr:hypothetical protein PLICRDRAFT_181000 [Plicaturopsis crispa FD-325 SS-3]